MSTCAEILTQMVAFDTVNASISHRSEPERDLAIYLEGLSSSWGLQSRRCAVPGGGFNLFLSSEVSSDAPWLLFDSHLDTVSIEGMVIDPLQARCLEGRLYGRGACDTKGSGASMLWALRQYSKSERRRLNVGLLFSIDEECGMTGASSFTSEELIQLTAASMVMGIVVGEPTGLRPIIAHGGLVRGTITARGRAAHSSDPSKGKSAISSMCKVISAFESCYVPTLTAHHPLAGRSTASINVIRGGRQVNIIPDFCEVEFDRRLMPRESAASVLSEIERALKPLLLEMAHRDEGTVSMESSFALEPLNPSGCGEFHARVSTSLESLALDSESIGAPWATNASHYSKLIPAVVLGPGDIAQAHTKDEWISLSELDLAGRLYLDLMLHC